MTDIPAKIRLWLPFIVTILVAAVGFGALRNTTATNGERIAALEQKLDERSLSLESTGAGRLIIERLDEINRHLMLIDQKLDRLERRGR